MQLPINQVLPDILTTLQTRDELVLEAPPGAGKTTAVPLALIDQPWRGNKKILVLEPRRVAARAAAERMADLLGEKVGERVGYRIRMETRVSRKTVIEVITEGVLTRLLQDDPELNEVAAVIFDEFHERSVHSDLSLALALQARSVFREADNPLKIIAMSATLNGEEVASVLNNAPKITSEGRSYPIDIHYSGPKKISDDLVSETVDALLHALKAHAGNALVFLPGQREIQKTLTELKSKVDEYVQILPLYGNLPFNEQQRALTPITKGRKVVLATDIAETSLTIDGVTIVIDAGLTRNPRFDPKTGLTRLHTERISRASATQRAGRAGRLAPGVCYRLWSEEQQSQLLAHTPPEILQADLAPLMLQLLQWGCRDTDELQWLTPPKPSAIAQALALLEQLNAINKGGLSEHGEAMAKLPLPPRLAHMLITCRDKKATLLAALLSDRCPLQGYGADIQPRLEVLSGDTPCPNSNRGWLQRTRTQARQFQSSGTDSDREICLDEMIAQAFPDRIAKRRETSRNVYLLSNGRSAKLQEQDSLAGSDWLAVCETGGIAGQKEDRIFGAVALNPALFEGPLSHLVKTERIVEWLDGKLVAESQKKLGAIKLSSQPLNEITEDDIQTAAIILVANKGLSLLPWTEPQKQWRARVQLLHQNFPDEPWPDVSDNQLLKTLESWLKPYLSNIKKSGDFKLLNLGTILQSLLPWPLPQQLDELAPTHLKVPSGSNIAIDYTQSPPALEVKLQEMFGCKTTPTVAKGKVRLLVSLLSPARRPLQITQDLEGFWNTSYQDVKKEMKGRYPKHPWPDDPWAAQATRYTKNRPPK